MWEAYHTSLISVLSGGFLWVLTVLSWNRWHPNAEVPWGDGRAPGVECVDDQGTVLLGYWKMKRIEARAATRENFILSLHCHLLTFTTNLAICSWQRWPFIFLWANECGAGNWETPWECWCCHGADVAHAATLNSTCGNSQGHWPACSTLCSGVLSQETLASVDNSQRN
jgi:hypothetical protein